MTSFYFPPLSYDLLSRVRSASKGCNYVNTIANNLGDIILVEGIAVAAMSDNLMLLNSNA